MTHFALITEFEFKHLNKQGAVIIYSILRVIDSHSNNLHGIYVKTKIELHYPMFNFNNNISFCSMYYTI